MAVPFSLRRAIGILTGATVATQAVNVAMVLVLARLYAPAEIGLLGSALAVATILVPLATLQLPLAIPQARDGAAAAAITAATLAVALPVTLACVGGTLLLGEALRRTGGLEPRALLLGAAILPAIVVYDLARMLAARAERFGRAGAQSVTLALVRAGVQTAGGLAGGGAGALAAGEIVGRIAALGPLAPILGETARSVGTALRELRTTFARQRGYVAVATPSALLDNLGGYLPTLVIAKLYGLEAAGFFFLAQRVVSLPVAMLVQSTADAVQVRAVALLREAPGTLAAFARRMAAVFAGLGLAIVAALAVLILWLWPLLFGAAWESARTMAAILLAATFLQAAAGPLSRLLVVTGRQGWKLAFDLVFLCAGLAPMIATLAGPAPSPVGAVAAIAAVQVAAYALYLGLILKAAARPAASAAGRDP